MGNNRQVFDGVGSSRLDHRLRFSIRRNTDRKRLQANVSSENLSLIMRVDSIGRRNTI
jgi:hypothetical protein